MPTLNFPQIARLLPPAAPPGPTAAPPKPKVIPDLLSSEGVILTSRVILSIVALPMVLTTFFLSLTGRLAMHR
jgi:hypothetical protein